MMNCNQSTCQAAQAKTVAFRVLDQKGDPVCGALFELSMENENGNGPFKLALSDKTGRVCFCGVLPGDYQLFPIRPPYGYEMLEPEPYNEDELLTEGYPVHVNSCVRINNLPQSCFTVVFHKTEQQSAAQQPPSVYPIGVDALTIRGYDANVGSSIELRFPCGCCIRTNALRDGTWVTNVPQNVTLAVDDEIDIVQCYQGSRSRRAVMTVQGYGFGE